MEPAAQPTLGRRWTTTGRASCTAAAPTPTTTPRGSGATLSTGPPPSPGSPGTTASPSAPPVSVGTQSRRVAEHHPNDPGVSFSLLPPPPFCLLADNLTHKRMRPHRMAVVQLFAQSVVRSCRGEVRQPGTECCVGMSTDHCVCYDCSTPPRPATSVVHQGVLMTTHPVQCRPSSTPGAGGAVPHTHASGDSPTPPHACCAAHACQ